LDLVGEKMTSLLPDPSLIDLLVDDDRIQDPLTYMNKSSELSVTLAEGKKLKNVRGERREGREERGERREDFLVYFVSTKVHEWVLKEEP